MTLNDGASWVEASCDILGRAQSFYQASEADGGQPGGSGVINFTPSASRYRQIESPRATIRRPTSPWHILAVIPTDKLSACSDIGN